MSSPTNTGTGDATHKFTEPKDAAMSLFRKKPVVIEAMRLAGNTADVAKWMAENGCTYRFDTHPTDSARDIGYIATLEGEMTVSPGDWIIRGVQGEFYPCKPAIFDLTYEPETPLPLSVDEALQRLDAATEDYREALARDV